MKPFHGFSKSLLLEILIFAIPSLFVQVSGQKKFEPKVVLYENLGGKGGTSLTSEAKNYPDLAAVYFNDKAQTACIVGTWLFYNDGDYTNYNRGVSYQFRSDGSCFDFKQILSKNISSFRFAGSPKDFRADVLDLFNGILFTDVHLRTSREISNVDEVGFHLGGASAIVHGESKWTLYSNPDFGGKSVCVSPQAGAVPSFYKSDIDLKLGNNSRVMSVRKGCHATTILQPSEGLTSTDRHQIIISNENESTTYPSQKPKPSLKPVHKPQRPNNRPRPNKPTNRPGHNNPHPHQTHADCHHHNK